MQCVSCHTGITKDEWIEVADCFDVDDDAPRCLKCAKREWQDAEESRSMNNPEQDGPAA